MLNLVRSVLLIRKFSRNLRDGIVPSDESNNSNNHNNNQIIEAIASDEHTLSADDCIKFCPYYNVFSSRTAWKLLSEHKRIEPFSSTLYAAVLFADISGFTRLSSKLNVEELKFHINEYFTSLLGVVETYHGDVIKFCGDAVMIMWPVYEKATENLKVACVELAALCALQLTNECGEYNRGEGDCAVSLSLHCGIGAGSVHCMFLGEEDRHEFLIAGNVLKQVGIAEMEADLGEVCISEEAYCLIEDKFEAETKSSGCHKLTGHLTERMLKEAASGGVRSNSLDVVKEEGSSQIHNFFTFKFGKSTMSTQASDYTSSTQSKSSTRDSGDGKSILSSLLKLGFSLRINTGEYNHVSNSPLGSPNQAPSSPKSTIRHPPSSPSKRASSLRDMFKPVGSRQVSADKDLSSGRTVWEKNSLRESIDAKRLRTLLKVNSDPSIKEVYSFLPNQSDHVSLLDIMNKEIHFEDLGAATIKPQLSLLKSPRSSILDSNGNDHHQHIIAQGMRSLLPEAARNAIEGSTLRYLAEVRPVTTLFVEVIGLERDFELGYFMKPQRVLSIALSCLQRFGGSLRQFVYDDKGCVLIGAFGLPGFSHEDNSCRGVEAAVAIRRTLQSVSCNCKIGISKGKAYCGLVGSNERCEYVMMGSTVNLAARLMTQAKVGEIVVNEDVYNECMDEFEFEILPKIKAKGFSRPVQVYSPQERTAKSKGLLFNSNMINSDKFIGRESELHKLLLAHQNYLRGCNDIIEDRVKEFHCVEAPAGIGKSYLLAEFLRQIKVEKNDTLAYVAIATASHSTSRYHVVKQLFNQIFRMEKTSEQSLKNSRKRGFKYSKSVEFSPRGSDDGLAPLDENHKDCKSSDYYYFMEEYKNSIVQWIRTHAIGESIKLCDSDIHLQKKPTSDGEVSLHSLHRHASFIRSASSGMVESMSSSIDASEETSIDLINLVPLLNEILPVPANSNSFIENLSEVAKWRLCEDLILRLLYIALTKLKCVFVVENLQWCDSSSLEVFNDLLKSAESGFFISSYRTAERKLTVRKAGRYKESVLRDDNTIVTENHVRLVSSVLSRCVITNLKPLSIEEVKHMARGLIGNHLLINHPEILNNEGLQLILKRTNGSPYLTSALSLAIRDALYRGVFTSVNELPSDENAIILNRFDQLTLTDQLILKTASVIGDVFTVPFLRSVLNEMKAIQCIPGLSGNLIQLVDSNLIRYKELNGEKIGFAYEFTDYSVRQGIYNLMLSTQKEATHSIVGLIMERERGDDFEGTFNAIASHFMLSDNTAKKLQYLEKASRLAKEVHQYQRTYACLDSLVNIATERDVNALLSDCTDLHRVTHEYDYHVAGGMLHAPGEHNRQLITSEAIKTQWLQLNEFAVNVNIDSLRIDIIASTKNYSATLMLEESTREVDYEMLFSWVATMSHCQFMLNNLKMCHNLAILAMYGLEIPFLSIEDDSISSTGSKVKSWWYNKVKPLPKFTHEETLPAIFHAQLNLIQVLLLRGRGGEASSIMKATDRVHKVYPSSSWSVNYYCLRAILAMTLGDAEGMKLNREKASSCNEQYPQVAFSNGIFHGVEGILESALGNLKSSRLLMRNAIIYFNRIECHFMKHQCVLYSAWMCLLAGRMTSANKHLKSLASINRTLSKSSMPKWTIELESMLIFLEGNVSDALDLLTQIKRIRRKDTLNATSCALQAFYSVHQRDRNMSKDIAISIQYACARLSTKAITTPISGVFLFCAGYAALKYCEIINPSATSENRVLVQRIKEAASSAMFALQKCIVTIPCLQVLYISLELMYSRIFNTTLSTAMSTFLSDKETIITTVSTTQKEFVFGLAFLHLQRAAFYRTRSSFATSSRIGKVLESDGVSERMFRTLERSHTRNVRQQAGDALSDPSMDNTSLFFQNGISPSKNSGSVFSESPN